MVASKLHALTLVAFVMAGCTLTQGEPPAATETPGASLLPHHAGMRVALSPGDSWSVVRFNITADDWAVQGGSHWLNFAAKETVAQANASAFAIFLVRGGSLQKLLSGWGAVGGWRMGYGGGDAVAGTIVAVFAVDGLANSTDLSFGLVENAGDWPSDTMTPATVVAHGTGAQLSYYYDDPFDGPHQNHVTVTDERARTPSPANAAVGPGSFDLVADHPSRVPGITLGDIIIRGNTRADLWSVSDKVGADERVASGPVAPSYSLFGAFGGLGSGSRQHVTLRTAAGALGSTDLRAFFVPWDAGSLGLAMPHSFSMPAEFPQRAQCTMIEVRPGPVSCAR